MKRQQSIFISSVLIFGMICFSLGWVFAKNINVQDATERTQIIGTGTIANNGTSTIPIFKSDDTGPILDIDNVWEKLQSAYYDSTKLDLEKLQFSAVKGFVSGIGDPYTTFMTPEDTRDFQDGLEGNLEGIGAELEVRDGRLLVVSPIKNSPAAQAGIRPGDIILKINEDLAEDMTFYDAIRKIRGPQNTQVELTIIRENSPAPIVLKITRRAITIDSVEIEKIANTDIFHVSIHQFNDHTKAEFENAISTILLAKADGMVLDLRGNGGGYLETSIDILSELIEGKRTGVIIKKRDPTQNETIKTDGSARLSDLPMVVLVDKGSASAAEIVAGAIQDYRRGYLIGEKTFGKGSVQEIEQLPDGSSLRLTIAKWFTPLDRSIDEVGITPDREVEITDEEREQNKDPQLDAAVQHLTSRNN